jgi:hypothetical protein
MMFCVVCARPGQPAAWLMDDHYGLVPLLLVVIVQAWTLAR